MLPYRKSVLRGNMYCNKRCSAPRTSKSALYKNNFYFVIKKAVNSIKHLINVATFEPTLALLFLVFYSVCCFCDTVKKYYFYTQHFLKSLVLDTFFCSMSCGLVTIAQVTLWTFWCAPCKSGSTVYSMDSFYNDPMVWIYFNMYLKTNLL